MVDFDPYFKWLAIPPEEQPPNHYRLLGLPIFVDDLDVIEGAAEQRTVYLRTFQTGTNAELAEQLLNEVSEARVCLLDGNSKARYDTQLKASQQPAQPVAEETVPEETPVPLVTPQRSVVSKIPSTRTQSRGGKPFWQKPWAIPAAAAGIVVVLLLLMMLSSGGDKSLPTGKQQGPTTTMVNQNLKVRNESLATIEDMNKRMSGFQKRIDELEAELEEAHHKASVHQRPQSRIVNNRIAVVAVENMKPVPLTTATLTERTKIKCNDDSQLPQVFHNATTWVMKDGATTQESNAWLRFSVEQSGRMYLIAHWQYEGNGNRGGWQNQRISLPHLKQGWNLIGQASWDPNVYFFSRLVDVGEEYKIRTNKYWPPYLVADFAKAKELGYKP